VGFDLKIPIGGKNTGTGAMAALPIWAQLMRHYEEHHGKPPAFSPPEGLTFLETCLETGLLPGPHCAEVIEDVFLPGTEPSEVCRAHETHGPPARDFRRLDHQLHPQEDWTRDLNERRSPSDR